MSEVLLPNPLHDSHTRADAEFQSYDRLEIVSTFGQPEAEYAAIRKAAALIDLPHRGVLEVGGRDRHAFLNNLLTNQTWDKQTKAGMAPNTGVYAYFLNLKGRIVADLNLLELGDLLLIETDVRMVERLRAAFEKYVFTEQVKMTSLVGQRHRLTLHGPDAASILGDAAGTTIPPLPPLASVAVRLFGDVPATVFRDDECAVPGFHLIVPGDRVADVWQRLLNQFANPLELGKRRLRPVGWAAYNACRIEGGRPLFDIDFGNSADPDLSVLPAEAGQFARAVSVTKGCYLGQEIVARMHARGQVAKQLVGLRVEADALPVAGATLFDANDNQIGVVTSSTVSPVLSNASIALGYLKKPFFAIGTKVKVPAEGAMRDAVVTDLPFVRT
jgi:folate-binding protein YgfZ